VSEKLSWYFELIDRISGPAKKASGGLSAIEKSAHGATNSLSKLHDAVELLYEAPQILGAMWRAARDFGAEVIGHMRFKQDSLIALEAMQGTRSAAIDVFEGVEDFAYKTGQGVGVVMKTTKDLLSSGFDAETVNVLRLMLADLRVVDPGRAEGIATILGEIGRRGELVGRQMKTLSDLGVDQTLMWEELSKTLGLPIEKLKKGSIAAGSAVEAIVSVVAKKWDKGVLGTLAEKETRTLPALIDRVKMIPERILDTLAGYEGGAGGGFFEKVLGNLADAFDPTKETGKRVIASLEGLLKYVGDLFGVSTGGLFAELAGPNGARKFEEIFRSTVDWVKTTAIPAMEAFAASLRSIAGAVTTLANMVNWIGGGKGPAEIPSAEFERPTERVVKLARNTLADPNASRGSREWATRILDRVQVTVNISGNASKEDIHRGVRDGVSDAFEQLANQQGAY